MAGALIEDFSATLGAAQAGDERAIATLWRALNHRVVRFLSARAGQAAEDIASETWLTVARGLHAFSGDEIEFRAWLFTIARSRLVDWQRRRQRRPGEVDHPTALSALVADDDTAQDTIDGLGATAALAVVATLPADQAEVILLRVLAGLDVNRVAQITGKQPGAVRTLQYRGLRRLREQLATRDPLADEAAQAPREQRRVQQPDQQGVTQ
jgi:RNA polymerase sigma-70 factor (ECF subfamily)